MNLALRHLWLFARIELGLTRLEFLALSPDDWRVAVELWIAREKRRMEREDQLVARLAFYTNISVVPRKKGDPLPSLSDFLPDYSKKSGTAGRKLTPKQVLRKAQQVLKG